MNPVVTVTQTELFEFLLNVAVCRPVFIWGPSGTGKPSIVQQFAQQVGLPCVSLLGSQLAPEDIIGVPQINGAVSRFCPPVMIARTEPYCLFLDATLMAYAQQRHARILRKSAQYNMERDALHIKREHAFLIPPGRFLPFHPKGPVFRIS